MMSRFTAQADLAGRLISFRRPGFWKLSEVQFKS